jgi:hypothetical protein
VVLILKMSSLSPGCEFDDQAHLCLLEAVDLTPKPIMFMLVGCDCDF